MKKLGFIALALVTVLTTLGIGYAMWSQTITVNGTVNTGNVTLQVSNYSGTVAYKDANSNLVFTDGPLAMGTVPTTPTGALWGTSYAYIHDVNGSTVNQPYSCTSEAGLTINMVWWNLFPAPNSDHVFRDWCADFDITNTGSIPVKLEISPISTTNATTSPNGGMPAITVTYTVNGNTVSAEGLQIEPTGVVHVNICLAVNESTVQSYNGSFSLMISGVQWNEYTTGTAGVPR